MFFIRKPMISNTIPFIVHNPQNPFKKMKNQFIITLLCLSLIGTIATAQTKKPTTTTKKPSTTVKSTAPKTTTTKTSTTTTTTVPSTTTTAPVVVEEKKTTTTTTTSSPTQSNTSTTNSGNTSSSTTIQQSSGPSKGGRKTAETKPEKVKEPRPERVREPKPERVREPRPERVRTARNDEGGIKFGIRAEATQAVTLESGGNYDLAPGVNAGLIINFPVSETIGIQPEILYAFGNAKVSQDANNYASFTSGSVLVPLMVNINLGQNSTKFMLNLGGYGNYLLNQNAKLVVGGVTQQDGAVTLGDDKFDYGAVIGLGVKINNSFMIEARGFYGLKDNTGKNGLGTIGIGYFF
jgi:Outer membrane protein beta-barrel domain